MTSQVEGKKENYTVVWICLALMLIVAPILQQPKKAIAKDSKGIITDEFIVTIKDVGVSNSGIKNCTIEIGALNKEMIGPCKTTEGLNLKVGHKYSVTRANITDSFISINKAKEIGSVILCEVKNTYVKARTPLMTIDCGNGDEKIVGNNANYKAGEYINSN